MEETVLERLVEEFTCAINAVFGDVAEEKYEAKKVHKGDIEEIAHKVKFYLDLE